MAETPARRSRRERPAKAALTRDGIVATAVELMRTEGLERVTMRRLAQELDTGPASLYVYLRNTAELHAAVLDERLGVVDLGPVTAPGDWRERLEQVLRSYTRVLLEHPGLAQSALVARPTGANYLNLIEGLLALLDAGEVPPARAAWAVDLLLLHTTANAAEHATRARAGTAEQEWDALTEAVRGLSADAHPHLAAVGDELLSGPPGDRITWGLRVLINGVLHTPRPGGDQPPNRK
ncbi:TetR/AcrR family transcriptional regulator [Catellatospora tritici]|uniref:TetR/AcrR family transcriptional regulator n=1 Tax=Catellatospora tritici TaxID=2851566 RepID=UPI001C2CF0DD|nr:TetR/AcrR family transcriptional regulator C-terminal domain-containing protein [Catellatospora tritici]MBV1853170.1 TetR/AcrR family transcriptional regulator C-terminal domain-containing protein [Catellatospora tritici]